MAKRYWLMKTEPDVFSIDDLVAMPNETDHWDGVRNYQARNFMRDDMKKGDLVLFYHSACKVPGVAGIAVVDREGYPDHTAFDKKSKYFDAKSDPENPRWIMVDIKFKKKFKDFVSLSDLKARDDLKDFRLLQRGNRLSVFPIEKEHFDLVKKLGK